MVNVYLPGEKIATNDLAQLEAARKQLTDFHLQLTDPMVHGYDLKEKTWSECQCCYHKLYRFRLHCGIGNFEVDRISDINWNTKPFESLVLPEGYKELILAFVESQIRDKIAFDDVINGKGQCLFSLTSMTYLILTILLRPGGGLVALLAGDPGVGKTLTAESGTLPLKPFNMMKSQA